MPAWRSASTQSAAIAMLGACISRSIDDPSCAGPRRLRFARALGIFVEAPGAAVQRDAAPGLPLFGGRHLGPALHLLEGAPASLAVGIALAGRADGDAGCVRHGVVPGFPRRVGGRRKAV